MDLKDMVEASHAYAHAATSNLGTALLSTP